MERDSELAAITDDLAVFLSDDSSIVLNYNGEENPFRLDFLYTPSAKRLAELQIAHEKNDNIFLNSGIESSMTDGSAAGSGTVTAARNLRCMLCNDKLYALRKYKRVVSENASILVLSYSGRIDSSSGFRDRSDEFVFNSAEEDDLFKRMVKAAGLDFEKDFVFQQYPACIFNAERSTPEDWNRRNTNCLLLVSETIKENRIKVILSTGPSAVFLAGEEMAKKHSANGKPLDFGTEDGILPMYIIRSPSAILAFEKKRLVLKEKSEKNPQDAALKKQLEDHLQSEKELKNNILNNLRLITEKIRA